MPKFKCEILEAHPCYIGRVKEDENNPFSDAGAALLALLDANTTIDIDNVKSLVNGSLPSTEYADGKSALLAAIRLINPILSAQYANKATHNLKIIEDMAVYKFTGGQHIGHFLVERRKKTNNVADGLLEATVLTKPTHIGLFIVLKPL